MSNSSTGALREHGPAETPLLVAPTALAARQWELYVAGDAARGPRGAWFTPAVSYRSFAAELWSVGHPERPPPLTPSQSAALWRRIVAESAEAPQLLGFGGPADWAAAAWGSLLRYGLDPQALRARPGEHDFAAFLRWAHRYSEMLRAHGWIDQPMIDAALPGAPLEAPAAVAFAGFRDWLPVQTALAERLEADGVRVERRALPAVTAEVRRARFADGAAEIAAAAAWAAARLAARPSSRIALVLPDAGAQAALLERALARAAARSGTEFPVWRATSPALTEPLLDAALTAIELVAADASFATFSRWLRNPFFAGSDEQRDARAQLELELRTTLHTRLPFREAYRRGGLAPIVRAAAPAAAAALDAALTAAERVQRASPYRWLELWQRVLTSLGLALADDEASHRAAREWQAVLDTFAQLTPVVGELDAGSARAELERIVAARGGVQPLPVSGVHVLERIDDLGPGYDSVWAAGFTAQQWPPPLHGNPLLPRAIQARVGMPGGSPQAARRAAERSFAAFAGAAPEIVVSWPARVFDYEAEPSPALRGIPDLDEREQRALERGAALDGPRPPLVAVADDAAPPLPGPDLPGGSAALRRQAEAPLIAFCEFRLHARPLEPVDVGVPSPMRGRLVHRAAELWAGALQHAGRERALDAVRPAVEAALGEIFGAARASLSALYELERERLTALLEQLAVRETERAPFAVEQIEQRREIAVGRWRVRVRLDRVDRLGSGGVAIIDYKTGSRRAAWWNGRLRDVQVPLYVAYAGEPVVAAVIVRLADGAARYEGYWSEKAFPDNPRKLPDGRSFEEQIGVWRAELAALADELGAGDTRLYDDELDDARTRYAVLTRVLAVLAAERRGGAAS